MKKLLNSILCLAIAAFALVGCEDVPSPFDLPEEPAKDSIAVVDPTGTGTAEDPYNVAAIAKLYDGTLPTTDVYVKGIVSSISEISAQYGNGTYYISDDGSENNQYEIYRGYGLGGNKFESETDLKVGDVVVVKGTPILYNTTKEFAQGSSIVSINGNGSVTPPAVGTPSGEGTVASPYNVAKAVEIINAGTYTADKVYTSGIICKEPSIDTSFGNATYYISDDGTDSGSLEVYRGYGLDGAKFESETDLKVGDKVIVYGALTKYGSTLEINTGSSIYSLNGKVSAGGGSEGGSEGGSSEAVSINGTTVTLAGSGEVGESVTLDLSTLGYENQDVVSTVTFSDNATAVFAANGETNGPKYYTATNGVRVYKNNTITFTGIKNIASIVITCDSYNGTDYVGNTTATFSCSGKTGTYTNVFTEATGGGVQLRVKTITINYAK